MTTRTNQARFQIPILLLVCLILVSTTVLRLKTESTNNRNPTEVSGEKQLLSINSRIDKTLLLPELASFDTLTLADIPTTSFNDQVIPYNNKLYLVQENKLIEYDPINKKILRQSDRGVFNCFTRSVRINQFLYVYCSSFHQRGLYVVDLDLGKLVKSYQDYAPNVGVNGKFPNDWDTIPNLVNSNLAVVGSTLWIGTWSGVFKIDTLTDTIEYFDQKSLGFLPTSTSFNLYANSKYVWITRSSNLYNTANGIAIYDSQNNSWRKYEASSLEDLLNNYSFFTVAYSPENIYVAYQTKNSTGVHQRHRLVTYSAINDKWLKVIDFGGLEELNGLKNKYMPNSMIVYDGSGITGQHSDSYRPTINIPSYIDITHQINKKYYLFTKNSIYILTAGEFPKFLKAFSPIKQNLIVVKTYVSANEKQAVISGYLGPMQSNPDMLFVYLLNIESGQMTIDETESYVDSEFNRGIFKGQDTGVDLVDPATQKVLFSINFDTQTIRF